jgi:tripartite-type tricarboxylate transporter receptor subunit TctC
LEVARAFTDAVILVENITGGATRLASAEVLSRPADGYTIFGAGMNHVQNAVAHGWDASRYIDGYYWIVMFQREPAAVLICAEARDAGLDFSGILRQAGEMEGRQVWAVPMLGGGRHFEVLQTWRETGITGVVTPFDSAANAAAAVQNGAAQVQMGSPSDAAGRGLWVAAVAAPARLAGFEDSPTFAELGFPLLNEMHMWRGFAVRRGTPDAAVAWFQQLVYFVSTHPDWVEYNARNAILPVAVFSQEFHEIVQETMDAAIYWRQHLGLME